MVFFVIIKNMNLNYLDIVIRNATNSDCEQLAKWWNDGSVMAHAGFPNGLNITTQEIAQKISNDSDDTRRRMFIEYKNQPIGELSFHILENSVASFGINICLPQYQNKGLGRIILSLLINELFNKGINKISIDTNYKNKRAQHVYELLGFKQKGLRQANWNGVDETVIDYELCKNEFHPFLKIESKDDNTDIKYTKLSNSYRVRILDDNDISKILEVMVNNPIYYEHCPPNPTKESIKEDFVVLPPNKESKDKYYLGFFNGDDLICILDLIDKYPTNETAFIGFFMMNKDYQHKGIGSSIITDIENYFINKNYQELRLGYVSTNKQSESFWIKNNFEKTGTISHQENYDVVVMHKKLQKPKFEKILMDEKNYDSSLPEILRYAVRGIFFVDGKLVLIKNKFDEVKIPGGGIEKGESEIDALLREVKEESGYDVIKESIEPFLEIEEKRMSTHEEMIWHQFNRIYLCKVADKFGECSFTEHEKKYDFKRVYCTIDEALAFNEAMAKKEKHSVWEYREYITFSKLKEYIKKNK